MVGGLLDWHSCVRACLYAPRWANDSKPPVTWENHATLTDPMRTLVQPASGSRRRKRGHANLDSLSVRGWVLVEKRVIEECEPTRTLCAAVAATVTTQRT